MSDQRIAELEAENVRLRKLVARYRTPMVDGGVNPRERLHVLKVKLVDAEAQRDEALAALRETDSWLWNKVVHGRYGEPEEA